MQAAEGEVDVSVCVATCRRPAGLARLLESLARQKLPDGLRVEVLVVDNAPEAAPDGLPPAAAPDGLAVRWLREPRRNIAHARNRAVEEARGAWLAFVDDDEEAEERWLAAHWECAAREERDGWFGPVLPSLAPGPAWLDASFFARPRFATGAPVRDRGAHTCNAFLRRALFREARFDPAYGRSGGSDTALFRALDARGARFAWCDEARVWEHFPPERRRVGWLVQRAFRGGCVFARIERELGTGPSRAAGALRAVAGAVIFAAAALCALPSGRATAVRWGLRAASQCGQLWSRLGGRYTEYRG